MGLPAKRDENRLAPLPANPVEDVDLSNEELNIINDYLQKSRYYPIVTSVLTCKGKACKFAGKCPLVKMGKLPKYGSECPIEKALLKIWIEDLVDNLDLDPTDVVDHAQVMRLVYHRLFDKRAMELLGEEELILDEFKTVTLGGEVATEKKVHPLIVALEKSYKISDRIMQTLIATRESKAEKKFGKQENVLTQMNALMNKVNKLKNPEKNDA